MIRFGLSCSLVAATALAGPSYPAFSEDATELVRNGRFASVEQDGAPTAWSITKPVWKSASCQVHCTAEGLRMQGSEHPYAVGSATQAIAGIRPHQAYAVEATCRIDKLPSPLRSIGVSLVWTRGSEPLHPAGMFVRGPVMNGETLSFKDVLVSPDRADGARLCLELKWPGEGSVCWRQVSVRPTSLPPPRKVKLGTVFLRPKQSTPEKNIELFSSQLDEAGRLGLDIVCLGEAITMVGTPKDLSDVAEPIPGPSTEQLGKAAAKNHLWVVAGLIERDAEQVYNTAVLVDRSGRLAGKYRKVHLPREEWQNGISPGHDYPVFRTDFGTVAMQICYDWFFPEVGTIFGLAGAEIVCAPTWGTTFPDKDGCAEGETVFRVRARDSGVYLVPSVYDGNSMVIDPMGRILASSGGREGVFWAEVDLNQREPLWWVGHWRSIVPRHRMPETYGPLSAEPAQDRP